MAEPVAYFITVTTYGTWLHGRSPGSVDREHNEPDTAFLPADVAEEAAQFGRLRQPPYRLDEARRRIVLNTILEVAKHRRWRLWAVHVRSNHVHVIVTPAVPPEKVMADFKAWASRRLREAFAEDTDRDRWTQHGSTRYLWTDAALENEIVYVLDRQGEPLARYDGRAGTGFGLGSSEPEA
jgi:REP element-mobilizing transposase RayT